ncbi:hypothetical protein [Lactobacillus sp.]|uniref:hypothetical protein n=1 Tax=Lactobacillus sp. TaxID=1591 RepID=UPI00199B1471|nr:hypothetical protein [Lactobacillus sp.]MBD5430139.1 hypothetical protein [Lactobacillus sp.]
MSNQVEHWKKAIQELKKLNNYQVAIGFFGERDSRLLTIVRANEYGAHIRPKNGQWLTIPTKEAEDGDNGLPRSAKEIKGLFRPKGKNILCVNRDGKLVVMYYLVKSVDIPARPFIRTAWIENKGKYASLIKSGIESICFENGTAEKLLKKLGETAASDIRKASIKLSKPSNAPVTVERKGSNNPLVDTGELQKRVTYKIIPTGGKL